MPETRHGIPDGSAAAAATMMAPQLDAVSLEELALILSAVGRRDFGSAAACASTCRSFRDALRRVDVITLRGSKAPEAHALAGRSLRYWGRTSKGARFTPAGAWVLDVLARQEALRHVRISVDLSDATVQELVQRTFQRHALLTVVLQLPCVGCVGPDAAEALASWLETSATVRRFSLCTAQLGVSGAKAFARAVAGNASLTSLRLARCGLLKADLRPLARALVQSSHRSRLRALSLAHNRLGSEAGLAIAAWLACGSECRMLDLSRCHLGSPAAIGIALALADNRNGAREEVRRAVAPPLCLP